MSILGNRHLRTAETIMSEQFPNRHKLKINWLQLEQDLRSALKLKIDDIDKLYLIDLLVGEHTGRGYELPIDELNGNLRNTL
jgi:hypothetical protein